MALHKLTFLQLKNEAEHAISGTPDSRTSTDRIVNGAIEYLCNCHPWSWRHALTTLSTVADQVYVDLPADFGELLDLQGNAARVSLRMAGPREVMLARVNGGLVGGDLGSFFYFIGAGPQTLATDTPTRRLELGPAPADTLAAAFYLSYRRLIPVLVGDTDVPAIPYGYFELLRVLVRAMSVSNTLQQAGHDWELFSRMLPDYCAADGKLMGAVGGQLRDQVNDVWEVGAEATLGPGTVILMPGE